MYHSINKNFVTKIDNTKVWTGRQFWLIVPCTFAVVAGPLITTVYRLISSSDIEEGSISLAQAIRGMLCLILFLSLFLSGHLRLLEHPIIRPLVFLAAFAAMTALVVPYPYENLVFIVKILFMVFIFASAFHLSQSKLCSENWLVGSAWAILFFMTISQAIGLVTGNVVATYHSNYATAGVIDQPSITAALIVSALPVFLRFFPERRFALAGMMVLLISLFFTMRRTVLIAALAAILYILIRNINPFQRRIPWRQTLLATLFLCILIVIGLMSQAGQDLLTRIGDLNPSEGTGSGRYVFWSISLKHIVNRSMSDTIMGEGEGSIRDFMEKDFGIPIGNHMVWLDITYSFGLFGLMAIVWWYIELLRFTYYLNSIKHSIFQGVFSSVILLFLISLGQSGFCDPSFALTYAALGFWSGQVSNRKY